MIELSDTDFEKVVLNVEGESGPHIGEARFESIEGESFVRLHDFRHIDYLINTRYVISIRFMSDSDYRTTVSRYENAGRKNSGR